MNKESIDKNLFKRKDECSSRVRASNCSNGCDLAEYAEDEEIAAAGAYIIDRYRDAFEDLAK